jgi:hypothetical protein
MCSAITALIESNNIIAFVCKHGHDTSPAVSKFGEAMDEKN